MSTTVKVAAANVPEKEAATYLGISVHSLRRWRWIGGGPKFLKLGSRVVYPVAELDAWQSDKLRSSTSDQGKNGKLYSLEQKRRFLQTRTERPVTPSVADDDCQ